MESLIKYVAVGLISFGVTFGLTPWVIRLARRLGFLDQPDGRRIHDHVVPRAGGVAVVLGFHSGCLAIYLLPWGGFSTNLALDWYRAILAPTVVLLITGLLDDRQGIPARAKLLGQAVAGWLLYWGGVSFGAMLGWTMPAWLDALITVLWCVGFINAFNLIDGLDGLAAGLGTLAALGLAGAFLLRGAPGDTLVMLALAASCLAFLRYNFHPARIFLGDTGSMFIGFTLAAVSLGTHTKSATLTALVVPLLAAGVPILDTALAIWRRGLRRYASAQGAESMRGKPASQGNGNGIMSADTEHLHHRLLRVLGSQRRVAWLLYGLNAALIGFGLLSVGFSSSSLGIYLLVFVMSSYVIVRHLANVELWNSGVMIARGLRRPPKKVGGEAAQQRQSLVRSALGEQCERLSGGEADVVGVAEPNLARQPEGLVGPSADEQRGERQIVAINHVRRLAAAHPVVELIQFQRSAGPREGCFQLQKRPLLTGKPAEHGVENLLVLVLPAPFPGQAGQAGQCRAVVGGGLEGSAPSSLAGVLLFQIPLGAGEFGQSQPFQ